MGKAGYAADRTEGMMTDYSAFDDAIIRVNGVPSFIVSGEPLSVSNILNNPDSPHYAEVVETLHNISDRGIQREVFGKFPDLKYWLPELGDYSSDAETEEI